MIKVIKPGPLATVQDLGRPGYGQWGIVPGGAADRRSFRLANRLVGNPESAAGLEITGGGFQARFTKSATIALTGACCPVLAGESFAGMNAPIWVPAGADVTLGSPLRGLRTYLTVRGGLNTPLVLGSRATDLVADLGMGALRCGDELPVGSMATHFPNVDLAPAARWPDVLEIEVSMGPRDDWFTAEAVRLVTRATYTVTTSSDRVGIRLAGPPLHRRVTSELPSEPAVRGAIEVPPDGQPILFLADHPTTCGYPVIAVAEPEGADLAAQLRPGHEVIFRAIRPEPG